MRRLLALIALLPCVAQAQAPATTPDVTMMSAVLRVADAPREAAFYESVLGMKTAMSRDLGAIHETMLLFGGDRARTGIMLISNISPGAAPLRGLGSSRMILRVSDLDEIVRRLDAAGIAHAPVRDVERGIRVLQIADPEANELELVQPPQSR